MNPLHKLTELGQSVWLDDIRRNWLEDGTFERMIREDALAGVTSNPAIIEKSISGGKEYEAAIRQLAGQGHGPATIAEILALQDVQKAADLLLPLYRETNGRDGYVSLEVSPHLANDFGATVAEARRLWKSFDRPNAMIKIPATREGLPAIRVLLSEGININVTLLFSLTRYRDVADAFIGGLEQRLAAGGSIDNIASVASFFVSRIDTLVDQRLDEQNTDQAHSLRGRAAIACATMAYADYKKWTAGERWQRLAEHGARPQRLLWASTSTKDPAYEDVKYVEALIAPNTVNTMPLATLQAYKDHGRPELRLEPGIDDARQTLEQLRALGFDLEEISHHLEIEGIRKFVQPFDRLRDVIAQKV